MRAHYWPLVFDALGRQYAVGSVRPFERSVVSPDRATRVGGTVKRHSGQLRWLMIALIVYLTVHQTVRLFGGLDGYGSTGAWRYVAPLLWYVVAAIMLPQFLTTRGVAKAPELKRLLLEEGLCPCCSDDLSSGERDGAHSECATCGAVWEV
jgi:hypothetical protein